MGERVYTAPMLWTLLLSLAATPSVRLEGAGLTAASFTVEQLKALGPVTVDWKDKSGAHRMTGVPVERLLRKQGLSELPRHAELRAVLIATAEDGFVAVFSVGELLAEVGPSTVLLAWEQDGKPLAAPHGVFRLVVPTDKKGARSLYQLRSLELRALTPR